MADFLPKEDKLPEADNLSIPVFLPGADGTPSGFVVGEGMIFNGNLVVKFKKNLPAVALQRVISRGEVVGITFMMPTEEENNEEKN